MLAETEAKADLISVQYSAWKLLVVETGVRVMLAYYGDGYFHKTLDALLDSVQTVCASNPGKPLTLLPVRAGDATHPDQIRRHHHDPETLFG